MKILNRLNCNVLILFLCLSIFVLLTTPIRAASDSPKNTNSNDMIAKGQLGWPPDFMESLNLDYDLFIGDRDISLTFNTKTELVQGKGNFKRKTFCYHPETLSKIEYLISADINLNGRIITVEKLDTLSNKDKSNIEKESEIFFLDEEIDGNKIKAYLWGTGEFVFDESARPEKCGSDDVLKNTKIKWQAYLLENGRVKGSISAADLPVRSSRVWLRDWPYELNLKVSGKMEEVAEEISFNVEILLLDEDSQLTPADTAKLEFKIESGQNNPVLSNIEIDIKLVEGKFCDAQVIQFKDYKNAELTTYIKRLCDSEIKPGSKLLLRNPNNGDDDQTTILVAAERNRWIFENLIMGNTDSRPVKDIKKPYPEKGFFLEKVISVDIKGKDKTNNKEISFSKIVPIYSKTGLIQSITFPDLTNIAGTPTVENDDEHDYYRHGDPVCCYPGDKMIRAVALRAARFGGSKEANMQFQNNWEGSLDPSGYGDGIRKREPFLFPEADIEKVVRNVADFVHLTLVPKHFPGFVDDTRVMAVDIFKGNFGPLKNERKSLYVTDEEKKVIAEYKKRGTSGGPRYFPCVAHSYLFGALLRSLGISVREVNIVCKDYTIEFIQDAASEVYYNGDWHFWALYFPKPVQDHQRYLDKHASYRMLIGIKPFSGLYRFLPKNYDSDIWMLGGRGYWEKEKKVFLESSSYIKKRELSISGSMYYKFRSPVAALVVLPDGRRVGALDKVDSEEYYNYLVCDGKRPAEIVNDIKGAFYYPEGLTLYPNSQDPNKTIITEQTVIVPVKDISEHKNHRIELKATGDGPYEIIASYYDNTGLKEKFSNIKGAVTKGQKIQISGSEFNPIHEEKDPGSKVAVKTTDTVGKQLEVIVEIDWFTDTLIAKTLDEASQIKTEQDFLQAIMPQILEFLEPIEIQNGITFGKLMKDIPESKKDIERSVIDADIIRIDTDDKRRQIYEIQVPMRTLRTIIPLNQFP